MASALLRARCGGTTLGQGPVEGSLGSGMKEQPLGSGSTFAAPPHLPRPPARSPALALRPACCRRLPTASLETSFDGALMPSFSRG